MADKGIPALTAADRLDGTELIHGVQSTNSRKITTLEISKIPLELKSVGAATYTLFWRTPTLIFKWTIPVR